ncbi:MAG: YlmH/Sll1252 family protein [Erysipelotrichaceae bacterium]
MNKNKCKQLGSNDEFVARIDDWLTQSKKHHKLIVTPFLSLEKQQILEKVIGNTYPYLLAGGYENAENKKAYIGDDEIDRDILMLRATYDTSYHQISHRDVLGAFMHAGIARDCFGDIHVKEGYIYVFVSKELEAFIINTIVKINHACIEFERFNEPIQLMWDIDWHDATLSSLRCDVLVAAISKLSRSKAQALIQSGYVKINQVILEDCDRVCNNNSTISIRGYGRFKLLTSNRVTKKGNIVVSIGTYR